MLARQWTNRLSLDVLLLGQSALRTSFGSSCMVDRGCGVVHNWKGIPRLCLEGIQTTPYTSVLVGDVSCNPKIFWRSFLDLIRP
jgi:hypothetical protein